MEFVCLPWSEVCSARVTSLLLLLLFDRGRYGIYSLTPFDDDDDDDDGIIIFSNELFRGS